MALFLILSVPVWFLLVVSLYPAPSRGWAGLFVPFLGGLLAGSVSLLVTLGSLSRVLFSMNLPGMFAWAWIRGPGLPMLLGSGVFLALQFGKSTSFSRIREAAAWLSGAAVLYTIWYGLTPDPGFDAYRVFFVPVLFIAAAGTVTWISDRALRMENWPRWALMVIAMVFGSLITLLPVLYTKGYEFAAWVSVAVISAGSTFLIYLDSRGRFS